MATRIRLRRMGSNKRPFYRVVVADQRAPRDGRFIEAIGKYHPMNDPSSIEIDEERALHWLRVGAQPSNQVRTLMSRIGIWERFVAERPSAVKGVKPPKDRSARPAKAERATAPSPDTEAAAGAPNTGSSEPADDATASAQPEAPPEDSGSDEG